MNLNWTWSQLSLLDINADLLCVQCVCKCHACSSPSHCIYCMIVWPNITRVACCPTNCPTLFSCLCFNVCLCCKERKQDVIKVIITLIDKMAPLRLRLSLFPAELQTACCIHCYPASSAQHCQRLLASGLWLWMYQFGDAEWDRPGSGNSLFFCLIVMLKIWRCFSGYRMIFWIYTLYVCVCVCVCIKLHHQ